MTTTLLDELLQLPACERRAIADKLYESVEAEMSLMTPELSAILDERIAEYQRHPERVHAWEDIKAELQSKYC